MPDTKSKTATLAAAIAQRTHEGAALRQRYDAAITALGAKPGDSVVYDHLAKIEAELSRNAAGLAALNQAHDRAVDDQRKAVHTAALAGVAATRKRVIDQSAARLNTTAVAVQAAGDAFVEAVAAWQQQGASSYADTTAVLTAMHGVERVPEALMFAGPAAAGTGVHIAEAVAAVHARAVAALGSTHSDQFTPINPFLTPRLGFLEAAEQAHATLVDRLGGTA